MSVTFLTNDDKTALTNSIDQLQEELADIIDSDALLYTSVNMFNPTTTTDGYIVNNTGLVETSGYSCSDYIEVDGSKTYSFRGKYSGGVQIVLYDENKNYLKQYYEGSPLSGSYSGGHLVIDMSSTYPNTKYVRVNMATAAIGSVYMFVEGSYPSEYVPYAEPSFKSEKINQYVQKLIEDNRLLTVDITESIAGTQQQNIAIGVNAGGGKRNAGIAIGTEAMMSLVENDGTDNGRFNVAIGHQAMRSATTSDHSTAIGYQALRGCTTGDYNTAIGEDAAMSIGAGNRNTTIGCRAMQSQTEGDDNVAVGALARYFNDSNHPTGSRNTAIGARAGDSGGAGSDCVHIGYGAKNNTTDLNNTIAIGSGTLATKTNQTVIGNNNTVETVVRGELIVRATDGTRRQIVFNSDGTCSWKTVNA